MSEKATNEKEAKVRADPTIKGSFDGDLRPGGAGSMLFGPGNPGFNAGRGPVARYDPIGPGTFGGEPDPDHLSMPGVSRPPPRNRGWGAE